MPSSNVSHHNLDIRNYSLKEIFDLFNLNPNDLTDENMKRAKWIVLKTHPDKSGLPSEYFLFYKKAFEIIVDIYNNQNKMNVSIPQNELKYDPPEQTQHIDSSQINHVIQSMNPETFQRKFNQLFESNQMGKPIVNKNEWFSKDSNDLEIKFKKPVSSSNLNESFHEIKKAKLNNNHQQLVLRQREVYCGSSYGNLYEDDGDDEDGAQDVYIPFGKLKYEDIKRVHLEETVIPIDESDYHNMKTFGSVKELEHVRSNPITPLSESVSKKMMEDEKMELYSKMMKKEYEMKKKELENQSKQKSVLSYFLQLRN